MTEAVGRIARTPETVARSDGVEGGRVNAAAAAAGRLEEGPARS